MKSMLNFGSKFFRIFIRAAILVAWVGNILACSQESSDSKPGTNVNASAIADFRIDYQEHTQNNAYSGTSTKGTIIPPPGEVGKEASIFVWVVGTGGKNNYLTESGEWKNESLTNGPLAYKTTELLKKQMFTINEAVDVTPYADEGLSINMGYGFGEDPFNEMIENNRYINEPIPAPSK